LFPNKDQDNPDTLVKIESMRKKIEFYVNKKLKKQIDKKARAVADGQQLDYEKEVNNRKRKPVFEGDDFFEVDESDNENENENAK
jgi:hypothetical protein